jgi:hypothetical protein
MRKRCPSAEAVRGEEKLGSYGPQKPVAMAVPNPTRWTLVDGVDLNRSTAAWAIKRANEIGRTFWNYARLSSDAGKIQTVGIILNGDSHVAPDSAKAHDYIHRCKSDADEAIDAHSTESDTKLRRMLAPGESPLDLK